MKDESFNFQCIIQLSMYSIIHHLLIEIIGKCWKISRPTNRGSIFLFMVMLAISQTLFPFLPKHWSKKLTALRIHLPLLWKHQTLLMTPLGPDNRCFWHPRILRARKNRKLPTLSTPNCQFICGSWVDTPQCNGQTCQTWSLMWNPGG